jgi:excinuclease ABC subunit A
VLVDRIAIGPDLHQRLVDTIEICYREAGEVIFESASGGRALRFNEKFQCKTCGMEFAEPEPILFSFNSPVGACPRCQGFGNTIDFDMDRVIPDLALARRRRGGAVDQAEVPLLAGQFPQIARAARCAWTCPFADLTEEERETLDEFIRRFFDHLETKKYKLHVRVFLSRYRGYALCPECKGARLRKEALYVRVGGKNLAEVVRMNIAEAQQFFDTLELSPEETAIADKILVEIRQRLKFLNDVGLEYLTLDRLASTLSGGEAQRIQLATCLGSRLVGAATCSTSLPSGCTAATPGG